MPINPQQYYRSFSDNLKSKLDAWDFPGAAQYALEANNFLAPYGLRLPEELSNVNGYIAKLSPEEQGQVARLQEANKISQAGANPMTVTKETVVNNPNLSAQQLANKTIVNYWSNQSEPYARVMNAINNNPEKIKFGTDEDGNTTISTGEHPGWDTLTLRPTGQPNVYSFSTYNQVAAGNISGVLVANPQTGFVAPVLNAAQQFAYTPGSPGGVIRNLASGITSAASSLGPLGTVALAFATQGLSAELGAALGLEGAAATIAGNTILQTTLNGGDVGKALTNSLVSYAGASAGGLASQFASGGELGEFLQKNPSYAATIANTATRAALTGQSMADAVKSATISVGTDAALNKIDGFSKLDSSVQNTIRNAVSAELQGKDVNLPNLLTNAAASGLTSYALSQNDDFKKLDPKLQSLVTTEISAGLRGKPLDQAAITWAINQGNQAIKDAVSPVKQDEAVINQLLDQKTTTPPVTTVDAVTQQIVDAITNAQTPTDQGTQVADVGRAGDPGSGTYFDSQGRLVVSDTSPTGAVEEILAGPNAESGSLGTASDLDVVKQLEDAGLTSADTGAKTEAQATDTGAQTETQVTDTGATQTTDTDATQTQATDTGSQTQETKSEPDVIKQLEDAGLTSADTWATQEDLEAALAATQAEDDAVARAFGFKDADERQAAADAGFPNAMAYHRAQELGVTTYDDFRAALRGLTQQTATTDTAATDTTTGAGAQATDTETQISDNGITRGLTAGTAADTATTADQETELVVVIDHDPVTNTATVLNQQGEVSQVKVEQSVDAGTVIEIPVQQTQTETGNFDPGSGNVTNDSGQIVAQTNTTDAGQGTQVLDAGDGGQKPDTAQGGVGADIIVGDQGDLGPKREYHTDGSYTITFEDGTSAVFNADGTPYVAQNTSTDTTQTGGSGATDTKTQTQDTQTGGQGTGTTLTGDDGSTITINPDGSVSSTDATDTSGQDTQTGGQDTQTGGQDTQEGGQDTTCADGFHWDADLQMCVADTDETKASTDCPDGYVYNVVTQACEPITTEPPPVVKPPVVKPPVVKPPAVNPTPVTQQESPGLGLAALLALMGSGEQQTQPTQPALADTSEMVDIEELLANPLQTDYRKLANKPKMAEGGSIDDLLALLNQKG